jgi:hypothetical protein
MSYSSSLIHSLSEAAGSSDRFVRAGGMSHFGIANHASSTLSFFSPAVVPEGEGVVRAVSRKEESILLGSKRKGNLQARSFFFFCPPRSFFFLDGLVMYWMN